MLRNAGRSSTRPCARRGRERLWWRSMTADPKYCALCLTRHEPCLRRGMSTASGGLSEAITRRAVGEVRSLIDQGAAVNALDAEGWTLLTRAVTVGDLRLVELLVDGGADVDGACYFSDTATQRLFDPSLRRLRSQPELNPFRNDGWTALLEACRMGNSLLAAFLVGRGANVNLAAVKGGTPLMEALRLGHAGIARHLLENGARVDDRDERGRTALHHMAARGQIDSVRLLLEQGANPNARDGAGMDALMVAARCDRDLLRVLLVNGANAAAVDKRGGSALLRAVRAANLESVEVLLQYGADELLEGRWLNGLIEAARISGSLAIQRIIGADRQL